MIAIDTNVLVYAHREEMPEHRTAHARLIELAAEAAPWALPVFCLGEFVRVVTHPRVFSPPSSVSEALAFLDALVQAPTARLLCPDERYFEHLRDAIQRGRATGNRVFEAQIAALCLASGATLLTADRDFARFGMQVEWLGTGAR